MEARSLLSVLRDVPAHPAAGDHTSRPLPELPLWVGALIARYDTPETVNADLPGPLLLFCTHNQTIDLFTVCVPGAVSLSADRFQASARRAYDMLRAATTATPHPIRIWNYIPSIHAPMGGGDDRYRVFNKGRFDAFASWIGDRNFANALPTATGIGHDSPDLLIHALCATTPGRPIENPRQCPAFRYSARFGPRPPCFSRGTIADINGRRLLLIGGTASVRGEESMHPGSLAGQLAETIENLQALVAHAGGRGLSTIRHARLYYTPAADVELAKSVLLPHLSACRELELVPASICRPELLIEIEAVADLGSAPAPHGVSA